MGAVGAALSPGVTAEEGLKGRRPRGIPAHAVAVYVGELFVVWEWPQTLYDGSVKTFEAATRTGGASVIALGEKDGVQGFYYSRQEQPDKAAPFEALFGGRLDSYEEDPLGAAQRELREEAGMESAVWELVMETSFEKVKVHMTEWLWVARDCKVVGPQTPDAGEKIEVLWRPLVELPDWLAQRGNRPGYLREMVCGAWDDAAWQALRAKLEGKV